MADKSLFVVVGSKVSGFEQGMRTIDKELKKVEKSFKGVAAMGKRLEGIGKSFTVGITLPILGAAAAATKFSTDFNASMANVATLIPGNVQRVGELKKAVQDLSIDTAKSTSDLADGLYQVVSAFGDSAETAKLLEINARAAVAGLAGTTEAINLTSAVTKGYGDTSAKAVQSASDLAMETVRLGQTTFPELAASIGRVVPLAASLGVSQEELFGVMATGTGVTGSASEVSTQLRGILQSLMAPTADMTQLFKSLGYESGQAMLKQAGLQKTISIVASAAEKTGLPLQKYISSIEGQTLALALAGPQADVFIEKLAAMANASGATDRAFKEQTEGVNKLGFQMAQLRNQAVVLAQQLGDALAPALSKALDAAKPVIGAVQDVVGWFVKLPPGVQQSIITLTALAAATGPALMGLGRFLIVLPKLASAFAGLQKVAGGFFAFLMKHPIILIVAGIVAAVLLLRKAWNENWGDIQEKTKFVGAAIQNVFTQMVVKVGSAWNDLKTTLYEAVIDMLTAIAPLTTIMPQSWRDALEDMREAASAKLSDIEKNLESLAKTGERSLGNLAEKMQEVQKAANWRVLQAGVSPDIGFIAASVASAAAPKETPGAGGDGGLGLFGGGGGKLITYLDVLRYKFDRLTSAIERTGTETAPAMNLMRDRLKVVSDAVSTAQVEYDGLAAATGLYSEKTMQAGSALDKWLETQKAVEEQLKKVTDAMQAQANAGQELAHEYIRLALAKDSLISGEAVAALAGVGGVAYTSTHSSSVDAALNKLAGFAEGGIAMHPMVARLAEKEPEIVIPLSKFFGDDGPAAPSRNTSLTINNYRRDLSGDDVARALSRAEVVRAG